ncbi:MAG TPA: Gfo/Idh/MocA family oxidoreductase [Coleofasciculaceae cyanobacterium]|jgi:biliverdin reductase
MSSVTVGLVGTGYAAKARADALQADSRSRLIAVAGRNLSSAQAFGSSYEAEALPTWQDLVERSDIDLVIIATVNRDHGTIARAALEAGKQVVVEYPLALDAVEAEALIQLAATKNQLLHIEHIELLSGIHLAIREAVGAIATPFYLRYASLAIQRPAPQKWTYSPELFGFPLVGAVSRIHRLTDLFGWVSRVTCQARFWYGSGHGNLDNSQLSSSELYTSCLCTAQLQFKSGLIADVTYGKGEAIWQNDRSLQIQGEKGAVLVDGQQGKLVLADETRELDMGSRRGLFAQDTGKVLDYLITGTPLYVTVQSSLHALKVADAARRSAELGRSIELEDGA